jgi:sulfite exporter TauE/SafE
LAWPCGLLQSALLVAGLANTAMQGAAVMAVFAASSALGLVLGPALWWRLSGGAANRWISPLLAVRLAGVALALASAWALGHGLWLRVAAWCFS